MDRLTQAFVGVFAVTTIALGGVATTLLRPRPVPFAPWNRPQRFSPAEEARIRGHEAALSKGASAQRRGDWRAAERAYREALRLEPRDDRARAELAATYDAQGRRAEALLAFREALRVKRGFVSNPADARTLARYGDLCLSAGDRRMAVGAYRAAVGFGYVAGENDSVPAGETLASLRLTAHGAAALGCKGAGDSREAEAFLRTATVPTLPKGRRSTADRS